MYESRTKGTLTRESLSSHRGSGKPFQRKGCCSRSWRVNRSLAGGKGVREGPKNSGGK